MIRTFHRRHILHGAGVALALPLLESLAPRTCRAADAGDDLRRLRARLVCIYKPHGVCNEAWYPQHFGPDFPDTPTLTPLRDYKKRTTFVSGLSHLQCPDGLGHSGVDVWLTALDPRGPRAVSVDQVVSGVLQGETRFPSLQLGTKSGTGSAQASFTLSYNEQGIPLPAENDPRRLFQRLFVGDDRAAKAAHERRLASRKSVLDVVLEQAGSVEKTLSHADRRKLDEYLGSVREVERRIEQAQAWIDRPRPQVASDVVQLDVAIRENKTEFVRTLYHLAALALATDSTRVVTLVTAPEGANSDPWPEVGLTGIHHSLQHHNGKRSALDKLAEIDQLEVALFAEFLARLQSADDADGDLLGRTLVLYGSGMNNGTNDYRNGSGVHGTRKLPLLLAGGERLGLKQGRHLDYPGDETPLACLFVSLLQSIGIERHSFQDAKGRLDGWA